MSDKFTDDELLLEQWKIASELHRHEDNLSWGKFQYFTTLNTALLGAVGLLAEKIFAKELPFLVLGVFVSITGLGVSFVWLWVQERGRMYQRKWIDVAKESEWLLKDESKKPVITLYTQQIESKYPDMNSASQVPTQVAIKRLIVFAIATWILLLVSLFIWGFIFI